MPSDIQFRSRHSYAMHKRSQLTRHLPYIRPTCKHHQWVHEKSNKFVAGSSFKKGNRTKMDERGEESVASKKRRVSFGISAQI